MSKAQQSKLNIVLSDDLANFLVVNPSILKKYSGCSYVVFPHKNDDLNRLNLELVNELLAEGKDVIKAKKTGDNQTPWKFVKAVN